jgi:hypothetical protein
VAAERVEVDGVGGGPPEPVGRGAPPALTAALLGLLAVVGLWWLVAGGSNASGPAADGAPADPLAADTSAPTPPDDEGGSPGAALEPVRFEPLDEPVPLVLVAPTDDGYAVLDPSAGTLSRHRLERRAVGVASAGPGSIFVATVARSIELVDIGDGPRGVVAYEVDWWGPSARPERLWLRFDAISASRYFEVDSSGARRTVLDRSRTPGFDPRLEYRPGGGLYDVRGDEPVLLGPHAPLAVAADTVLARRCDDLARCRLEVTVLESTGTPSGWQEVSGDAEAAELSPDGRWAVLSQAGRSDRALVDLRGEQGPAEVGRIVGAPGALVRFHPTGVHLVVLEPGAVTVVDLDGLELRRLPLPASVDELDGWVTVAVARP